MKPILLMMPLIMLGSLAYGQEGLPLPEPQKHGGKGLMDCLNERRSSREYVDEPLNVQQLSDLLWAANGINRPESGKRTTANSRNKQEMDLYVFLRGGVYRYDVTTHGLLRVLEGDHRAETGKQDFVGKAAVNLVYVADYARIGATAAEYKATSALNAGLMVQNVYLYCASAGLATVVRGYFDAEPLHRLLGLGEGQEVIITQSVGPEGR
ncbi:MAG TPA: SagB/ThcOx family dehydrogenase [Bacteroidales bacterium]|nr:SagB/ThcOx family dehydrogenase [Bacteroidales bacterium]HRZ76400.1 SagB/ThcOx family dehydrogenase [Bacteroidales bacterium]